MIQEFYDKRTAYAPKEKLQGGHGKGCKDNWEGLFESSFRDAYAGKEYPPWNGFNAHEIHTMGMQKMFTDPVVFAYKDPEYFAFTLRVMGKKK